MEYPHPSKARRINVSRTSNNFLTCGFVLIFDGLAAEIVGSARPASVVRRRKSAMTSRSAGEYPAHRFVHRAVHPRVPPEHLGVSLPYRRHRDPAPVGRVAFPADPAAALEPVEDAGHGRRVQSGHAGERARAERAVAVDQVEAVPSRRRGRRAGVRPARFRTVNWVLMSRSESLTATVSRRCPRSSDDSEVILYVPQTRLI